MELKSYYSGGSFKLGIDFYVDDPELLVLENWQGSGQEKGSTVAGDIFGGVLEKASIRSKAQNWEEKSLQSDIDLLQKLRAEKKYDEAKRKAKSILEHQPQNIPALQALAELALEEKQGAEAAVRFGVLVKLDEKRPEFIIGQARAWLVQGDKEKAAVILENGLKALPDNNTLRSELGALYLSAGRLPEAQECYEAALGRDKENISLMLGLGQVFEAKNEPEEALMVYQQAVKLNSRMPRAYHLIGRLLLRQNKVDAAVEDLKKAVINDPAFVEGHLALAEAYIKQNQLEKAGVEYSVVNKIAPENFDGKLGATTLVYKGGKLDEAYNLCKEMLNTHGDRAELHLLFGRILAQKGRTRDAVEAWQKALSFTQDAGLRQQANKSIEAALQWEEVSGT
jgi:tetratricopeptide (TPR) repeat protein